MQGVELQAQAALEIFLMHSNLGYFDTARKLNLLYPQ